MVKRKIPLNRAGISIKPLWAKLVAQELKREGANIEGALAAVELEQRTLNNAEGWIPFSAHAQLLEIAAKELNDDCFGLHFAETIDVRDVGLIGYLGIASKTLEDGFHNLARYLRIFSEAFQIELKIDGGLGTVLLTPQDPTIAQYRQAVEFGYCVMLHTYRQITGKRLTPSAVHFVHHRRSNLPDFAEYFGCPVKFARNQGQMVFSRRELATPILSSDDRLLTILRKHAQDILRRRPKPRNDLVRTIERRLIELLPSGQGRAKIIATELGISERTLVRRLDELDTSFADIVDHLRNDLAQKYLAQDELSLMHIAFLLGYSNQSAFTAACKRWTGSSPREVRDGMSTA